MIIDATDISFSYGKKHVLSHVSFSVAAGEFVAVIGCNGSGKSTLALLLDALVPLDKYSVDTHSMGTDNKNLKTEATSRTITQTCGSLTVAGIDVRNEETVGELRQKVGIVFQNPDNQFVSPVVEEDIAFGLENYAVPEEEIAQRVADALALVGMSGMEKRTVDTLSGGQKQRIAIAGVLAMDPELIIFDEATSMLDPCGRREVMGIIDTLHKRGKTIFMITHFVEETVNADKVLVMKRGKLVGNGSPRAVFGNKVLLEQAGIFPPVPVRLFNDLGLQGEVPLTVEELCKLF